MPIDTGGPAAGNYDNMSLEELVAYGESRSGEWSDAEKAAQLRLFLRNLDVAEAQKRRFEKETT